MTWMALLVTALFLAGASRYGADSRDGRDWQPWRMDEGLAPGRRR